MDSNERVNKMRHCKAVVAKHFRKNDWGEVLKDFEDKVGISNHITIERVMDLVLHVYMGHEIPEGFNNGTGIITSI